MKTKTKFLSVLCALFMLIVSVMGLGGVIRVRAYNPERVGELYADYVFPQYVWDYDYITNIDESLTSLYYFSDYDGSEDIFENGFVRNYINQNPNITYSELIYDNPLTFWDKVGQFLATSQIENAFIIFELRSVAFPQTFAYGEEFPLYEETIFEMLGSIFSDWKENQCKIMFIDGLDEVRYVEYNMFLEYVDMHVIIDLFTTFVFSIFSYVEKNNDAGWNNITLVLDEFFGQEWFIKKYLALYLVLKYNMTGIQSLEKVFDQRNISIYVYHTWEDTNGKAQYDFEPKWGTHIPHRDFYERWTESPYRVVIGRYHLVNEEYLLYALEQSGVFPSAYFVFNAFEASWPEDVPEGMLIGGISLGDLNYWLSIITRAFILNDSCELQKFNNVEGRCDATFIPLGYGDSWQTRPGCFCIYCILPPDVSPEIFN